MTISLKDYQRFTAIRAIAASTVRGQGRGGVVKACRLFLAEINIEKFAVKDEKLFERRLDAETEKLRRRLPKGARSWGLARKALNIFLRDCLYSVYIEKGYRLKVAEAFFEVPLDRNLAKGLCALSSDLPCWKTIKNLKPKDSNRYQEFARRYAKSLETFPVHLDVVLWTKML